MKIPQISLQQCFERLETGEVIVCVNRRLARSLTGQYARFRQARGDRAWPSADILPYGAWLARVFEDFTRNFRRPERSGEAGFLLDEFQEQLIWEQVISESRAAAGLLDVRKTAQSVRDAWQLCCQWKVPVGAGMHWQAPDPAVFARWADAFGRVCRQSGFMDRARLAGWLAAAAKAGNLACASGLILAGFDELAPADNDLFDALARSGVRIAGLARAQKPAKACWIGFEDDDAEIRAAAKWARKRAENASGARIGIVSLNLAEMRRRVLRVFEEVFYPSVPGFGDPPEHPVFTISAPPMLSEYPMAAAAWAILDLAAQQKADVPAWSRLLRCPFLAGGLSEYPSRAVLDAALRERGDFVVSVPRVAQLARSMSAPGRGAPEPAIWTGILENLQKLSLQLPEYHGPDQWARVFCQCLDAAGWPGQRSLSSREYQVAAAFRQSLERFARLFSVTGELTFFQARQVFVFMLTRTPFQPEQAEAPVQILGLLEAASQEFDELWIMGMHHDAWPSSARPDPFIPAAVSRTLGLPHCSPERELAWARQMTSRLLTGADRVVCSYGQSDGESLRLPSPLIAHLPQAHEPDFRFPDLSEPGGGWIPPGQTEKFLDVSGAPVPLGGDVSGGTGILKSQAACPFQAYGRYRLGGRSLEMPVRGLNARDRGSLVHSALELLWTRLRDFQTLTAMDQAELSDCIQQAVDGAVKKMAARMPETFTPGFAGLETDRLKRLLFEWMKKEQNRSPFSVIAVENRTHVTVGGIGLRTFADRIDQLENGGQILIDYKTGATTPNDWFTPRIAEPQLPLYSLSIGGQNLAGVLFARVKKGQCAYLGIAASEGVVEGIRCVADDNKLAPGAGDMAQVVDLWQSRLTELGKEIGSGHAPVAPESVNKTCRYCDLAALCRIWEVRRENDVSRGGAQ